MQRILLIALTAVATTACWDDVTSKPARKVPETAQGKKINDLKASLQGETPTPTAKAKPGKAKPDEAKKDEPGPSADAKMRTVEVNAEAAARGKATFAMCAGCHGAEAEGKVGTAPRLASKSFLAAASDRMLIDVIKKGRPGTTMIPWGKTLKEAQIHDIIAWLRTEVKTEPAKLDEKPLNGDLAAGEKIFRQVCAACHGRHGGGYEESGSGTGIMHRGFLATATNGFIRYIAIHGKDLTPMRPFIGPKTSVANLRPSDIENIIAHMRKNAW